MLRTILTNLSAAVLLFLILAPLLALAFERKDEMTHETSRIICQLLNIDYIDFSIPENFIQLMDLVFKFHKYFNLHIKSRNKNFLEDTLSVLSVEIEEEIYEHPLKVKEFACIIKNEYWSW